MTCGYCGSRNSVGEHRCRRCGRRPDDTLTADYTLHRTEGGLAIQSQPQAVVEEMPQRPISRAYQPTLFPTGNKVIPIQSYTPVEPPKPRVTAPRPPRPPKRSRVPEEQGSLDFLAPAPPKPRTLSTTVEAMIFCDAPVAVWLHRAVAAAIDWGIVLLAYGAFVLTYALMGGGFTLDKMNLLMFAGALMLIAAAYGLTWTLAGAETFGMQCTRLKLLTFDGFPPDTKQRMIRLAGSALGLCTVIGLAWLLVDEEGLGWQDHMSRTFPTPSEAENLTLIRK
jgi:uncharacterized RDD family membrane protein YckC